MKSLIALSLLLSGATAMAAPKTEIMQTKQTIKVNGLHCTIRVGAYAAANERTFTEISSYSPDQSFLLGGKEIILNHFVAVGKGCLLYQLDKIKDESNHRFGFMYGVPVEVTRVTHDPVRLRDGSCAAHVHETLKIELDPGITLTSEAADRMPAKGCP